MSEQPEWLINDLTAVLENAVATAGANKTRYRAMAIAAIDYMEELNGGDMAKGMRMTRKNARTVLTAIADRIEEDKDAASVYCRVLNELLDELLGEDFFGSEGQIDPRGDRRNL